MRFGRRIEGWVDDIGVIIDWEIERLRDWVLVVKRSGLVYATLVQLEFRDGFKSFIIIENMHLWGVEVEVEVVPTYKYKVDNLPKLKIPSNSFPPVTFLHVGRR